MANFRIRNPRFTPRPLPGLVRWPTSAKADGEEFELLAIHSGLAATGLLAGSFVSNQCTEILFRIGTNSPGIPAAGGRLGDWSIQTVDIHDLFGNALPAQSAKWRVYGTEATDYRMRADDGIARVPWSLWVGQDWNVRAAFIRNPTSSLDQAHRWIARIPVPAIATRVELGLTGHVYGCTLELQSMDNVSWVFGRGSQEVGPTLSTRFIAPRPGWRLEILDAQDQTGSNIPHRRLGNAQWRFQFATTLESKELQVTFGVLPVVTVELSGKASIFRTNVGGPLLNSDHTPKFQ